MISLIVDSSHYLDASRSRSIRCSFTVFSANNPEYHFHLHFVYVIEKWTYFSTKILEKFDVFGYDLRLLPSHQYTTSNHLLLQKLSWISCGSGFVCCVLMNIAFCFHFLEWILFLPAILFIIGAHWSWNIEHSLCITLQILFHVGYKKNDDCVDEAFYL